MKTSSLIYILLIGYFIVTTTSCTKTTHESPNRLTPLQKHFAYTKNAKIIISGHRGTRATMYPENSLEGMQYALKEYKDIIFEIDPRLTKDSVIVLMHDATLDRTTTATGKLSDFTWAELQEIRLKDYEGNITDYKIPLLKDVIEWSKGKTVVNLDKKDVPLDEIVSLVKECEAEEDIMLTVHTGAQARYYYDRLPNIMFSVFARNNKEYEDIAISGVPWNNMIAYVGHTITDANAPIVEMLHLNGVKCMISTAPTHDKLKTKEERMVGYYTEIARTPDIIETDIPSELSIALMQPTK